MGPGKPESMVGPKRADLQGMYRMARVVLGTGRARKVEDVVYRETVARDTGRLEQAVQQDGLGDIVLDQSEFGMVKKKLKVLDVPGNHVVEADDPMALLDEAITEMGANETGPSGD